MMDLHFDRTVRLDKLHDELTLAVPSVRPTLGEDGLLHAVMLVTGGDDYVDLQVPDDADVDAIAAVVDAHDPTPDPPPPTQAEQVDLLVADGKAALAVAPIQTDEGRALAAIFAGALDGLGKIYGTLPGGQP